MGLKTLAELRQGARQRSDSEDDGNFVTDDELDGYINESLSELYDLMIAGETGALFSVNAPILAAVGDNAVALPDDFYRLVSLDYLISGYYLPGRPCDVGDLARFAHSPPDETSFRYLIRWNARTGARHLYIYPMVDLDNLALVYFPEAPELSGDNDTFSGPNQWHEHVMVSAAAKIVTKQEGDTTSLEFRRAELTRRILRHVDDIDVAHPPTIRRMDPSTGRTRGA